MIDWRRVPWTLWLLTALSLATTVRIELLPEIRASLRVFTVLFVFGWIYLLLRGFRGTWIATVALFGVSLVIGLATGPLPDVYGWSWRFIEIGLLLLPVTRRFFAREPNPTRN